MVTAVDKKGALVENKVEEAQDVFDVQDYLYKVFNAAAKELGPNPDLSTPENRALATLVATTAQSIAAVDERTKTYTDEYNMAVAYKQARKESENRERIGFKPDTGLKAAA